MKYLSATFLAVLFAACSQQSENSLQLTNPSDFNRKEVVKVDISQFSIKPGQLEIKSDDGQVLNAEGRMLTDSGNYQDALILVEIPANTTLGISVVANPEAKPAKKMTQAEISVKEGGEWVESHYEGGEFVNKSMVSVPASHKDHSYYIRYEGPGWESDLVGYRFYLDWRNGADIFGKATNEMVLQDVGQDGFESYHHFSEWGMDVLKVGKSIGIGSMGRYLNDSLYRFQSVSGMTSDITRNGLLKSEIKTEYDQWVTETDTVSLVSTLSIEAASRATKNEVQFSQPLEGFCSGLVISKGEEYIQLEEGDYTMLATYGDFSLNKDKLGMAIIAQTSAIEKIEESPDSHLFVFKPSEKVTYYYLAAWEKEPNGITNVDDFKVYLHEELQKMNHPITIK